VLPLHVLVLSLHVLVLPRACACCVWCMVLAHVVCGVGYV